MACHLAHSAHVNILAVAFRCFVAHFIAFEAKFLTALEGVVGVLAAQDAVEALALVRTIFAHVAEEFAVATLDGGVGFGVVAGNLGLHLFVLVVGV